METFSALLAICAGNSPVPGEFPAQRPVTRSFDVFCDLRLNKRLSKQSWGWWFEALSPPFWRHHNEVHLAFWQSRCNNCSTSARVDFTCFLVWTSVQLNSDSVIQRWNANKSSLNIQSSLGTIDSDDRSDMTRDTVITNLRSTLINLSMGHDGRGN